MWQSVSKDELNTKKCFSRIQLRCNAACKS